MIRFAHIYELTAELLGYSKGRKVYWNGNERRFYFHALQANGNEGIYVDKAGMSFTLEQVSDKRWFKPCGSPVPFIPPFPARNKVGQFVSLEANCRLVNDVDECRALNDLINDKEFQTRLYNFYRTEYNCFHGIQCADAVHKGDRK